MTAQNIQDSQLITVFGGSGFVGRHIVRRLARAGFRVRVAVRRPDLATFLQPLGAVGQIMPVQANIRDRTSVTSALRGADGVVNLVGILFEKGQQTFSAIQAEGPHLIARTAHEMGIQRFVQMSAIGADDDSPSLYARSKAAGETAVLDRFPGATILRPSIIFGAEDNFFNRFAAMSRMTPVLPLFGDGQTRFQPVFVGDVAQACAKALAGEVQWGRAYELGGPAVVSFKQCLELMLDVIGRQRMFAPLPFSVAALLSRPLEFLPEPPFTRDQIELLKLDNIVSEAAIAEGRTLSGMDIAPHSLEAMLPTYLQRFSKHGQYDFYQSR